MSQGHHYRLHSSSDSERKRDINTHDGVFMVAELPSNVKEYPGKSTNGSAIKQHHNYRAWERNHVLKQSLNFLLSVLCVCVCILV